MSYRAYQLIDAAKSVRERIIDLDIDTEQLAVALDLSMNEVDCFDSGYVHLLEKDLITLGRILDIPMVSLLPLLDLPPEIPNFSCMPEYTRLLLDFNKLTFENKGIINQQIKDALRVQKEKARNLFGI